MYVFVTLLCAKYVRLLSIRAFSSRRLASWQLGVSFPFFVALIQSNCPAFRPPNPHPPSYWGYVSGSLKQLPESSPACYSLETIGGVRFIPKFYICPHSAFRSRDIGRKFRRIFRGIKKLREIKNLRKTGKTGNTTKCSD